MRLLPNTRITTDGIITKTVEYSYSILYSFVKVGSRYENLKIMTHMLINIPIPKDDPESPDLFRPILEVEYHRFYDDFWDGPLNSFHFFAHLHYYGGLLISFGIWKFSMSVKILGRKTKVE